MKVRLILAATVAAFQCSVATADGLTLEPAAPRLQRMIDTSRMPLAPITVRYDPTASECDGEALACANATYFGVSKVARDDVRQLRGLLLHEAGHVFDFTYLTDADHDRLKRIFGFAPTHGWWTGESRGAAFTPGEWFADSYSICARQRPAQIRRATWNISGRQVLRVCDVIEASAAR